MTTPAFLRRFPCTATLYDGEEVTIRSLQPGDKAELLSFFLRVPEDDRFYLNSDVAAPEVIGEFTDRIDLEQTIPLVATVEDRILADATLHRSRRAARRHVGEIRVVVDPEYRNRGLGVRLIHELIQLGRDLELRTLVFELVSDHQQSAIQAARGAGFEEIAVLHGRVLDIHGSLRDLVILELTLDDDPDLPHFDI
jgi:L-amino acid N-acyltransferase YncA